MIIVKKITSNQKIKDLLFYLLMPTNQPRPRLWVKYFMNPLVHAKGKRAVIRKRTRMDVMPFRGFKLGNDTVIEDFATVNNGVGDVIIGDRTRIGIGSTVIGPVVIGNDVRLAQNVVLSGLNHNYEKIDQPISKQGVSTNLIHIGDESWIGANSVVVAGIKIGKHCIIAGGSVVTKDTPPYSVVAGNPARVIKIYNEKTGNWEKFSDELKKDIKNQNN